MRRFRLYQKFIDGLKKYDVTLQEITDTYKYAGGDYDHHDGYFKLRFREEQRPPHASSCVCGHGIINNAYISDGSRFIVIGSCCIRKFIPKDSRRRTCDTCGTPHRNRVVNRCKKCRVGLCDVCGRICKPCYSKCYMCAHESKQA